MKFYTTIQETTLDNSIIERARRFAIAVTATTNYADSHQTNIKKIQADHFISKLGEEAATIVLSKYTTVRGPDYSIYDLKQKSWEPDLFADGTGIAVKTQTRSAANKYSLSWTFQAGEKRRDTILNDPKAWVIFVECNDYDNYRCYVYPPLQIKQLIFREPRLLHLKNSKKVVYASSFI